MLNVDLPCNGCRYNLRGLTGDPVRCPECGALTPVLRVSLTPSDLAAYLRRMESALTASLLLPVAVLGTAASAVLVPAGGGCLPIFGMVLLSVLFIAGPLRFSGLCESRPSEILVVGQSVVWASLWRYVLGASALSVLALAPVGSALVWVYLYESWLSRYPLMYFLPLAATLVACALARFIVRPLHKRLLAALPAFRPDRIEQWALREKRETQHARLLSGRPAAER